MAKMAILDAFKKNYNIQLANTKRAEKYSFSALSNLFFISLIARLFTSRLAHSKCVQSSQYDDQRPSQEALHGLANRHALDED